MVNTSLLIYGCGTQGAAIIEWIAHDPNRLSLRLTDDNPMLWGQKLSGYTVEQPQKAMQRHDGEAVCAIGDNTTRWDVLLRLQACGHPWGRWCHSTATVASSAVVGLGSIVMPQAVLDVESRVGCGCLINTSALVSHHCTLGDAVHLAPGAKLGGGVRIGNGAFLGIGAVVLPGIHIGRDAVVGAGAVVLRNVEEGSVVAGNPAKPLRTRAKDYNKVSVRSVETL